MSSIYESIARTRELLDFPKSQKPSLFTLYGATVRNFQNMYNRLSNTNEAWSLGEKDIQIEAGKDVYDLADIAVNLGKPLVLTTFSASDASQVERVVPFYDVQNLEFDWFLPRDFPGVDYYSSSNHTAERVSFFYNDQGLPCLKFLPAPQYQTSYRLKYTIGNWADKLELQKSPILAQFHHLFEIRSAKDALYMSEWDGLTKAENIEKRREIKPFLDEQEMRVSVDFDRFIKEMTKGGIVFRRAWDE